MAAPQAAREIIAQRGRRIAIELPAEHAWAVLANLQLALAHPQNTGPAADLARTVALEIQQRLAPPGSPLATFAAEGWKPRG